MMTETGVAKIRLRGTNPALPSMLPVLYSMIPHCPTLGSFVDEAMRYLASSKLDVLSLEFHAGTREVTLMVRG